MGVWKNLLGTLETTFRIGRSRAALDASGLSAARTLTLPDASVSLAGVAGQLGGTGASPDVRGLRETGGPTLLTMGAVADGSLLSRSGSTIVGATAGQWKRLATATASSSATIDFTGLSSSYNAYMVVLSNVVPATDNVSLWIRTSANNGSSYAAGASDYSWARVSVSHTTTPTTTTSGDHADSQIVATAIQGNAANEFVSGIIRCYNPILASYTSVSWELVYQNTVAAGTHVHGSGMRRTATATDAIRFLFSSGNIASGQFDLYGLST